LIYDELGRKILFYKQLVSVVRYLFKMNESGDEYKYIKKIYGLMLNDLDMHPQKNSWAKSIKELLDHLGFSYAWLFQ
jgi:Zn/Cd-binding protein ZinT